MKYTLFLSDFDGTLARTDKSVLDETLQAISRYKKAGGEFVIVTGRGMRSILPILRKNGLNSGLLVAMQGATILDMDSGKTLRSVYFKQDVARRVIACLEQLDDNFMIYTPERYFALRRDFLLGEYEYMYKQKALNLDSPMGGYYLRKADKIQKILVLCQPKDRDVTYFKLQYLLGDDVTVTCSGASLVEMLPVESGKQTAIPFLSEYFQVPAENIAAIGDEMNDIPMLEAVGGRFAVGNAVRDVKKIAMEMPTNDQNGVGAALAYIMGETL